MKILIAGASGAIGQPLIDLLAFYRHDVYGITQSKEHVQILESKGAKPLILNVLERESVFAAIGNIRPDVVIDMLTRLPKEYTPEAMRKSAEMNAKIRLEGGSNLQTAAEMYGATRYIAQSSAFWYAPGLGLADEHIPFAFEASPGIASGTRVYAEIEKRVLQSKKIAGVALRFGFFYGPGTWFYPGGSVAEQICKQKLPIIGKGQGVWNFVHIEDAARAIVSALQCTTGVYNIVNDYPSEMRCWLPAFANYLGAQPPPNITEEEGIRTRGADAVYYATKLRGASNTKAKKELHFLPRQLEWLSN
jgi:2-alkyl-3-oxoalkanoate reductase